MRFGLFDHIDRAPDRPLGQQYDERLQFVAAADEAGFFCYHLAEHHATPLNTVPVPGVFLGAVARATKRMCMGPMVYLLPLYSPLRLIEEICILDHLSGGRFQVGVGRGVSAFELNFHKVDAATSRDVFADAYGAIVEGLTHERLTYKGPFYEYADVPMVLRPLQQPHPPFWYGSSNATGATWSGERGMHFVTNGGNAKAKPNIDAFRAALAAGGGRAEVPLDAFPGGVAVGASRQIVVAETDEEALRIVAGPHEHLYGNLTHLARENAKKQTAGGLVGPTIPHAGSPLDAINEGSTIAGSPETVRAAIAAQERELGINYLVGYFMFGDMQLAEALRSLQLFAREVMPAFEPGSLAASAP